MTSTTEAIPPTVILYCISNTHILSDNFTVCFNYEVTLNGFTRMNNTDPLSLDIINLSCMQ